jgi:hypothetical protein
MTMIRQGFREEGMSHMQAYKWKNSDSPRLKLARQVGSKVKSMFIIFFDIKGIVHKEFVLVAQTVNCTY